MVIKPPGNFGRRRIFEIDNGVLITVKIFFIEQRAGAVHQARELKIDVRANTLAIKTRKQGRRGGSVKTFAVKKHPDFQKTFLMLVKIGAPGKATRNDIPEQ